MLSGTVVVLDSATTASNAPDDRRLIETVRAGGMTVEEADSLDGFASALRTRRASVGVVAYEALWPDPQRSLRALRDKAPGTRLVVAYSVATPRLRLGQRLWSVGLCDYFVSRASAPHELTPILRQAHADALIESAVDATAAADDPAAARLYNRMRFLHNLNAALTNQRRIDGLLRELQMKLPSFMDYIVLEVLIAGSDHPELHVFQTCPVEHQLVWRLADEICTSVSPFVDEALTPESLQFVEPAPANRTDDTGEVSLAIEDHTTVIIPMVFCGELVGGIGVIGSPSQIDVEHRAVLQLVAYQLATSIRNAQAFEAAETASLVDELTGACNRRYLKRAMSAEWRRSERYRSPLSVAMLDIDHFKHLNDAYGHVVGDAVLRAFASTLRQQLRDTDHLVRYGGEEFLLILPETDLRDATLVVERIRLLVSRTPAYASERTGAVQITVSAGVAAAPSTGARSGDELINAADEALMVAKTSGRDRVCVASAQGFDTLTQDLTHPGAEKRRFSRVRSQLPVRLVELPEFEARVVTMSATDLSAGGVAVEGTSKPLKKNAYALVYLGDEDKPRLSQVMWTRDGGDAERAAGLQFVSANDVGSPAVSPRNRRALLIAQDPHTRATIQRVMSAAQYHVRVAETPDEVKHEQIEDYSLLVLAESSLRGELGEVLQKLREREPSSLRIALINDESRDRRAALDTIRAQHADHLLPHAESEDTLFATASKLLLAEYFGLKKYLLWGAETRSWSLRGSGEKPAILDTIRHIAAEVRCHPRVADLLVSAVDEMIINALYRPEPVDAATGRSSRPVTVECGSDGRFLGVAVLDEHGLFCHDDLFRGIGKALEHEEKGIAEDAVHAHLGFRIMLSTLSHLVINVDPGRCTEIIGLVDLRKSLKEHRMAVPSLGMFTTQQREK